MNLGGVGVGHERSTSARDCWRFPSKQLGWSSCGRDGARGVASNAVVRRGPFRVQVRLPAPARRPAVQRVVFVVTLPKDRSFNLAGSSTKGHGDRNRVRYLFGSLLL